jgi:hypothetical protein
MKVRLALGFGAVSAIALLSSRIVAADALNITTRGDMPVHEILMKIEEQYHWRIAYEEGPILFEQDLIPVASPTGRTMFVHRARPVSISLPALASNSIETKRATLKAVFEAFNGSGNPEEFRALDEFGYINVFQTKIVGQDGRLKSFEPLLDTAIMLPRQSYSLYELVSTVINQVSAARKVSIMMATIPTSLFINTSVTEESSGEPARTVLMRAFETVNGPRLAHRIDRVRLTWDMMYDPTERTYFFNVDNIGPEIDPRGAAK